MEMWHLLFLCMFKHSLCLDLDRWYCSLFYMNCDDQFFRLAVKLPATVWKFIMIMGGSKGARVVSVTL